MNKETRQKIKTEAKSSVAEILADEVTQKAKLEEAIIEAKTMIADLQEEKSTVVADNTKLVDQLEEIKAEKSDWETLKIEKDAEIEELKTKVEDATKRVAELEKQIEDIKKESKAQSRTKELEESGLLSSGDHAKKQLTRIRDMSDEEFVEYKSELLELRASWESRLQSQMTQ